MDREAQREALARMIDENTWAGGMVMLCLPAAPTRQSQCPTCKVTGYAHLTPCRLPRACATCSSTGVQVLDIWDDPLDRRAYQLGLAPIRKIA